MSYGCNVYDINQGDPHIRVHYRALMCVNDETFTVTLIANVTIPSGIPGVTHNLSSVSALDSVTPIMMNTRTSEHAHT